MKLGIANASLADWFDGDPPKYWPVVRWLRLPLPYRAADATHELVHVYNDALLGMDDDYVDEGMAYTAEAFYGALVKFKDLENVISTANCEEIKASPIVRYRWKAAWAQPDYTKVAASYEAGGPWPLPSTRVYFSPTDLHAAQLQASYGLRFSCSDLAVRYNAVLRGKGAYPCVYFSCVAGNPDPRAIAIMAPLPLYVW
jgi:hypothetical protein